MSTTDIFADGSRKVGGEIELWVAPDLELPASFEAIREISFLSRGDAHSGLPLGLTNRSYQQNGEEIGYSMQAIEVKKGTIDASIFEIPAGYAKVEPYTVKP